MRDRSLKDEMRAAVRGDRERAEARRKAEEEGAYTGPAPPTLDLNKPTREWKLPAKGEQSQPAPEPEEPVAEVQPEPEPEPEVQPEPEPEPPNPPSFFERLQGIFRRG